MANAQPHPSAAAITLAGLLSLAVAMGIGRFAFTPLLPLMLRDGQLDIAAGGWLAAANYAGYLAGALSAARTGLEARKLAAAALLGTAALTAAMALPLPVPVMALLRFLAGLLSAWAFVATSVWCLGALSTMGRAASGGRVYAGVGAGIAGAGAVCLAGASAGASAASLWVVLALVALALTAPVLAALRRVPPAAAAAPAPAAAPAFAHGTWGLVLCYGVMGFGYILPATFLPVLAREVIDEPRWFGLAWPAFGLTAAVSTVVAARWLASGLRLRTWSFCQLLMALGVALPALWRNGWTIGVSALAVGGTFMVITLAGVQEMRDRAGADAARWVGRLSAAFAAGQIAGPIVSSLLLQWPLFAPHALDVALFAAAITLAASGAWLWRQAPSSPSIQEVSHVR